MFVLLYFLYTRYVDTLFINGFYMFVIYEEHAQATNIYLL